MIFRYFGFSKNVTLKFIGLATLFLYWKKKQREKEQKNSTKTDKITTYFFFIVGVFKVVVKFVAKQKKPIFLCPLPPLYETLRWTSYFLYFVKCIGCRMC